MPSRLGVSVSLMDSVMWRCTSSPTLLASYVAWKWCIGGSDDVGSRPVKADTIRRAATTAATQPRGYAIHLRHSLITGPILPDARRQRWRFREWGRLCARLTECRARTVS